MAQQDGHLWQTINPTPMSEPEMRKGLLRFAQKSGGDEAVKEVQMLLEKWDAVMRIAPADEREQMAHLAILELERLLSIHSELRDGLSINGKIVKPGDPGWRKR